MVHNRQSGLIIVLIKNIWRCSGGSTDPGFDLRGRWRGGGVTNHVTFIYSWCNNSSCWTIQESYLPVPDCPRRVDRTAPTWTGQTGACTLTRTTPASDHPSLGLQQQVEIFQTLHASLTLICSLCIKKIDWW